MTKTKTIVFQCPCCGHEIKFDVPQETMPKTARPLPGQRKLFTETEISNPDQGSLFD